jgi:hypothetical protein
MNKPLSKADIDRIRRRLAERRREGAGEQRLVPPIRHQGMMRSSGGTCWLESLAGEEIAPESGRLSFSEDLWRSDRQGESLSEIHSGLRETDAGDFASDDEVAALLAKWTSRAGLSDPQEP